MSYKRIISLLPAATEWMFALAAGDKLVGRSHACDFPTQASALPICTRSHIDVDSNSASIDDQVRGLVAKALSLYEIDWELMKTLQPDLIITQNQCKVCAISEDDLLKQVEEELGYAPMIFNLEIEGVQGIYGECQGLANLLEINCNELLEDLSDRVNIIAHKIKFVKFRPTVLFIEWIDPLMVAGHWNPELIEVAGGIPVLSKKGHPSTYITLEKIIEADPDVLLIAPCGFDLERSLLEYEQLKNNEQWQKLTAVQKGHVFICDGNAYFNRPGPRLVDSIELVAEILQVNQFYYGLEHEAWKEIPA